MWEWADRNRVFLLIVLFAFVVVVVVLIQVLRPTPSPIILSTSTPVPAPQATSTPSPLVVYVSGAVRQPDVYTLPADSIAKDAMMAAGGPTEDADLDRINLAAPVVDGQHVYVPHLGEENPPVDPPSNQRAVDTKVNINTADAAMLESLPGIGPGLAQRIIDYRQANGSFVDIEDIMNVAGIGPGTFGKIEDLITTD